MYNVQRQPRERKHDDDRHQHFDDFHLHASQDTADTLPSIDWEGKGMRVWFIPLVDKRVSVHVKLCDPSTEPVHTEPHMRSISSHVASLPRQEPEKELNKLLLTKVSDRERNVKVNNYCQVEFEVFCMCV